MEENKNDLSFLSQAESVFSLPVIRSDTYAGLPLAFIGDGVYELLIRTLIISRGNTSVNRMHNKKALLVKASTQAQLVLALMEKGVLTEKELSIVKRGKNTSPHTKAKNASTEEYLWATGFEALCGYLYLNHEQVRLMELVKEGLALIGEL